MRTLFRRAAIGLQIAAFSWMLAACGGSGDDANEPPTLPKAEQPAEKDVVRFLSQAGFGASGAQVARTQRIGFPAWLNAQFSLSRDRHQPYVDATMPAATAAGQSTTEQDRTHATARRPT